MKTVFTTCVPRTEVLAGDLREEMFAARLRDVMDKTADDVYKNPRQFFENTFPTEGLRTLLREVIGRMSGKAPTNSPFIRLETSFGGGKTHNLIALYHLTQAHADGLPDGIVDEDWIPEKPWATAGIVGSSDTDPANGIKHGDVTVHTLWGELAWQLGKKKGFDLVRKSDEMLVAPGPQFLEELIGDKPALIMLDEVARHLRVAKAVPVSGKRSNLAEQTVAFLMTLIEFASSRKHTCVVVTLADSQDAFADETDMLKTELAEARRVSARQERVITPTGETEISRIVTHRLFKSIDYKAAKATAAEYTAYFSKMAEQGVEVPPRILRADYEALMVQDYPFHPEFLTTLTRKTATIPNFQKTRGALRLLARVVRLVWEQKPKDAWTIGTHYLDVGDNDIANDLTSRLERPAFKQVIEADIVSPKKGAEAKCQVVDRRFVEAKKPEYARRTAINVFLHSLSQGIATGVDPADLLASVLQPGDDPQLMRKALSILLAEEKGEPGSACWFLHWDGQRYRFKTEPSLEKIIEDELGVIGKTKAKGELDQRIQGVWRKGVFKPCYFPAESAEVDDDAGDPKVVVVHYDAARVAGDSSIPPDLVTKLFSHAGTSEGFRTFKNNLMFLVADQDQADRMVDVMLRHLAIGRIVGDADRMREFSDEQKKKLKGMKDSSELDVRIAVTRAYRHLFYPTADAPKAGGGLARESIPAQDQGEVEKDQTAALIRVLKQLQKVLTADDEPLSAAYVKAKAWPQDRPSLSTEELRREFCKRIGLKIMLDVNQLKKTIKSGVGNGTWVYFDAHEQVGYGKPSPSPLIQISDDDVLYVPEEAAKCGIKIKGVEEPQSQACPLCGNDPCTCAGGGDGGTGEKADGDKKAGLLRVRAEGAPAQVFQKIADEFHDAKADRIGRLVLRCEGAGLEAASDARALGLAVPQLGKGQYRIEQAFAAEFGQSGEGERVKVEFTGTWDRYKRVKQITDEFGKETSQVNVRTSLVATYADGLTLDSPQFQTMRDVFTQLGMGKIVAEAEQARAKEEV